MKPKLVSDENSRNSIIPPEKRQKILHKLGQVL